MPLAIARTGAGSVLRSRILLLSAALLLTSLPALAQPQGVGYHLSPSANYLSFEDNAALTDGALYGGSLGLSFGELVELSGLYFTGRDFRTDFSGFAGLEESPELAAALAALPGRDVNLQRYGGELLLRLGGTALAPFLVGGTGLVRFDPEGRDASESIYVSGGGGLQLIGADRYALSVQVSALSYRYNPGTTFFTPEDLAAVGLTFNQFNQTTVTNLSARAALRLYLGGRRPGQLTEVDRAYLAQFGSGLGGLSLQVEPFYSRLRFDQALAYSDQSFLGGEAGVDLGPLVGLRAFYGRGVQPDDPFDFQPIQMYGGLVRLRLSDGQGLLPYLSVGAGYLDVLDEYEPRGSALLPGLIRAAEDRPFALGGAGLEIPLSPRLRIQGEARAILISDRQAEDVSSPEEVTLNPMYRFGATFGLGGRRAVAPDVVTRRELDRQIAAERQAAALRVAELELEIQEAQLRGDALEVARLEAEQARAELLAQQAVRPVVVAPGDPAVVQAVPRAREVQTAAGERLVVFPVPERGEIYVRYGEPGGVQVESFTDGAPAARRAEPTEAELRAMIREAVREALAGQAAPPTAAAPARDDFERRVEDLLRQELTRDAGLDRTELQLMERRLADRLASEIRALRAEMRVAGDDRIVVVPGAGVAPGDPVRTAPMAPVAARGGLVGFAPVTGFSAGRGPGQLLLGVRGDYRPGTLDGLRYYPEILFGLGGPRSFSFSVNGVIPFPGFRTGLAPYGMLGFGLINYAQREVEQTDPFFDPRPQPAPPEDLPSFLLTLNTTVGAEFNVGTNRLFAELNAVNLSRFYRLMVGYRLGLW